MTLRWKDYLEEEELEKLKENFCFNVTITAGWSRHGPLTRKISDLMFKEMADRLIQRGIGDDIPPERRDVKIQPQHQGVHIRIIDKDPSPDQVDKWVHQMSSWYNEIFVKAAIRAIPKDFLIEPPVIEEDDHATTSAHIDQIGRDIIEKNGGMPDLPGIESFIPSIENKIGQARWQDVFRKINFTGLWGSLNFVDGEAHSVTENNFLETDEGNKYYCFGVHFMTQEEGRARKWHACTPRSVRKWGSIFKHAEEEIAKSLLEE